MAKIWDETNARIAIGALDPGAQTLAFDKDKCVYCEACVIACPRRAISLRF